ncbi:MAG: replicative DNA helicase [Daejeonella sp.]
MKTDFKTERRTRPNNAINGLGKLPPQATDLEEAVLGALMMEKDALTVVSDILKPAAFYKDSHQKIYQAIATLFQRSSPIDILTVTAQLRQQGDLEMVGGAYFITELTDRVASAANIEFHARIIAQKFIQRELIRTCSETISQAYEDTIDIFDLTEEHQSDIYALTAGNYSKDFTSVSELIPERLKEYEQKPLDGITGVGTGFKSLDKFTSGWQPADLIIIGARPSMGKTAFALQTAKSASLKHGVPVGIFSLEMNDKSLVDRLISSESGVFQEKIKKRELSDDDFKSIHLNINGLLESKIFIDDSSSLNMSEVRSKALRMKQKHGIGLLIIDYLQLAEAPKDSREIREQVIGNISRGLKNLAKDLNIPVIALSQLNRKVEDRADKRPQLSDIRESGSIEQDADVVIFLHRPEYYGFTVDYQGNSTLGKCELIFAKHRNGACETIELKFNGALMKFTDPNDNTEAPDLF